MITSLLPKSHEIREQSIMFNESMRAFGYRCEILIPRNIDLPNIGYHQNIGYDDSDKFVGYVSIDPHPRPKLLQSLGWNIEDDDTKPMLCYISRYLQPENQPRDVNTNSKEIVPTKYTRLTMDYNYEDRGKDFIVTKVSSNEFNPIYYILMIVPYRPKVQTNPDPLQDENVEHLNLQEFDNQFRFINNNRPEQVNIKY